MTWFYISIFIISCFVLARSGIWVVKALIRVTQFFGLREFIVASVLMAFFTSLPELFVGITSAISQKPQLSFGVVIGSNIADLTVLVGFGALLARGLKFKGKTLQRASLYAGIYALLPLILMLDGEVSRIDGIILLLSLTFYFFQLLSREERFTKIFSDNLKGWFYFKTFLKDLAIFIGGIVLLLLSAEGIVYSASKLALILKLPLIVIGAILVGLGTSLPELAFEIRAIEMGHKKMILGDIMGSVVVNSSLVLGLAALISPFSILNFSPYFLGILFTVATCLFFIIFARTDREITEKEAMFLLGIYFFFAITEILAR